MKILLDMNIPLSWKHFLLSAGYEAIHWRDVGDIRAADSEIMAYARSNYLVVFTHDLDFGAILAATNASGPSVIQLRMSNIVPESAGKLVLQALEKTAVELAKGALVTIDPLHHRIRLLPFGSR